MEITNSLLVAMLVAIVVCSTVADDIKPEKKNFENTNNGFGNFNDKETLVNWKNIFHGKGLKRRHGFMPSSTFGEPNRPAYINWESLYKNVLNKRGSPFGTDGSDGLAASHNFKPERLQDWSAQYGRFLKRRFGEMADSSDFGVDDATLQNWKEWYNSKQA